MTQAHISDYDQENIYKLIVQTAEEGICTLDDKHRINFVNDKLIELIGYSREEMLALEFSAILPSAEREKAMALIRDCNKTHIARQDVTFETKSGGIIYTTTTASQMVDQQGNCKGTLIMIMDITARKASVEAIKDSEAQFRSFFENSMDGFLLSEPNGKIFAANPAACALFQMSEEEICKMPPGGIFAFAEPKLIEVLSTRDQLGRAKADVLFIQKDGKEIPGEVTSVLFENAKGIKQSSTIIRDVSDRSHRAVAEETLQRSEANLHTIFNNTDVGYVLVDTDLKVLSYNDPAIAISLLQGYKEPQEGESILEYFAPERHEVVRKVVERVLQGEKIEYELSRKEPDGTEKWYNLRWIPITGEENQHMGVLLSIGDITKVKIAAIERERITAELLLRYKDLEQFAFVISHNLRAPVANVIGLASLIEDELKDREGAKDLVECLKRAVKKLDDVISDLNHVLKPGE